MGLLPIDRGSITATPEAAGAQDIDLASVVALGWTRNFAYVPQRPDLGPEGRTLSLGQRHLAAIESAYAQPQRPVLVFDEPTAHLDSASRGELITRLQRSASHGHTVIVSTHEPELLAAADVVVDVRAAVRP